MSAVHRPRKPRLISPPEPGCRGADGTQHKRALSHRRTADTLALHHPHMVIYSTLIFKRQITWKGSEPPGMLPHSMELHVPAPHHSPLLLVVHVHLQNGSLWLRALLTALMRPAAGAALVRARTLPSSHPCAGAGNAYMRSIVHANRTDAAARLHYAPPIMFYACKGNGQKKKKKKKK